MMTRRYLQSVERPVSATLDWDPTNTLGAHANHWTSTNVGEAASGDPSRIAGTYVNDLCRNRGRTEGYGMPLGVSLLRCARPRRACGSATAPRERVSQRLSK
jgi:hypothetical protein